MLISLFQNKKALFVILNLSFGIQVFGFRVVLDPGHGGRYLEPDSVFGDKYDPVSEKFLEGYRPGASIKGLNEYDDVYEIAVEVKNLLDLVNTPEGKKIFHKILKKYDPGAPLPSESIESILSRGPGYRRHYWETDYDINRDYRLYDHRDIRDHTLIPGVISRINAYKPELVVSIHLTGGNPGKFGGMSAVITPAYNTYKSALGYVNADPKERIILKKQFESGKYNNWFISRHGRSAFEWFLCDAWIYFTGYWSTPDGLEPDSSLFRGYRQNLVTWSYTDPDWMESSGGHPENSPYAAHLKHFSPNGSFWEREMAEAEHWRRENGPQGYGGDNLYASEEILRFIRKGLLVHNVYTQWNLPPLIKPYISTWSVPTYVNAVSAYLELAYLDNPGDYQRIYRYKKIHAEGIAAGIYSLLAGSSKIPDQKKKDLPWGAPLDLNKYRNYNGQNYFEMVSP